MSAIHRPAPAPSASPVPPRLAERLGELPAALAQVIARHGDAQAHAAELASQVEAARAQDRREAASAARAGKKLPTPSADAVLSELSAAQREAQAASDAAGTLAADMLDAAREFAPALAAELTGEADEAEARCVELLSEAAQALDAAGQARSTAAWCHRLVSGRARPWSATRTPSRARDVLTAAQGHVAAELAQGASARKQREREREREAVERAEIAAQMQADAERDAEERAKRRSAA